MLELAWAVLVDSFERLVICAEELSQGGQPHRVLGLLREEFCQLHEALIGELVLCESQRHKLAVADRLGQQGNVLGLHARC